MPWTKLPESQGGKSQDLGRGTDLGQGLRGGQSAGGGGLPCCPASSAAAPVRRGLVRTSGGQAEALQGKSTPCPFPLLCGVGAGWSDRWGRTDWLVASASRDPRICPPGGPPPRAWQVGSVNSRGGGWAKQAASPTQTHSRGAGRRRCGQKLCPQHGIVHGPWRPLSPSYQRPAQQQAGQRSPRPARPEPHPPCLLQVREDLPAARPVGPGQAQDGSPEEHGGPNLPGDLEGTPWANIHLLSLPAAGGHRARVHEGSSRP